MKCVWLKIKNNRCLWSAREYFKAKIIKETFYSGGDGKQKRDFINVYDVVETFIKSAFSKSINQIYNVGTGKPNSVNKLVKILKGKKIYIPERPGEPKFLKAKINKIKNN